MSQYASYLEFPGWGRAQDFMRALIEREHAESILELGAGRTPTFEPHEVQSRGLAYTVNDIEAGELELLDPAYETLCLDMSGPLPPTFAEQRYDLIFSRMVNEHVADGATLYRNIFRLLRPGGMTVHFFATFFTFPTLVNRLAPEKLSDRIYAYSSRGERRYEKFPARYSWCRGPTPTMQRRLREIGFEIEDYRGYFGHGYYGRIPALHRLELAKMKWLLRHPHPSLTSYATVMLRKPASASG